MLFFQSFFVIELIYSCGSDELVLLQLQFVLQFADFALNRFVAVLEVVLELLKVFYVRVGVLKSEP